MEKEQAPQAKANIEFTCMDDECKEIVSFNLLKLIEENGETCCTSCHRAYQFDDEFIDKMKRLKKMIVAVQDAEDILGDTKIAVTTMTEEIKIPYSVLMTRLTTLITLNVAGQKVDFNFRVEPLNNGSFH